MNLKGNEMRKFEYILDIFKGTCELNSFSPLQSPIKNGSELRKTLRENIKDIKGKFYSYGNTFTPDENIELSAFIVGNDNVYRRCEIVNLAVKTLNNIGIYDVQVNIDSSNKELVENLEMIDLDIKDVSTDSEKFSFSLVLEDRVIGTGGYDGMLYFTLNYKDIDSVYEYREDDIFDVFIKPNDESVLEDALAIATNLKDAGFKIEVDYELESTNIPDASFLVTFDSSDIGKYVVHLKDLKTHEEREVMIDNLVEELSFI